MPCCPAYQAFGSYHPGLEAGSSFGGCAGAGWDVGTAGGFVSTGDVDVSFCPSPLAAVSCWAFCCCFFLVCREGLVTRHFFSLLRSWVSLDRAIESVWSSLGLGIRSAFGAFAHLGLKSSDRICLITCLRGHSSSL